MLSNSTDFPLQMNSAEFPLRVKIFTFNPLYANASAYAHVHMLQCLFILHGSCFWHFYIDINRPLQNKSFQIKYHYSIICGFALKGSILSKFILLNTLKISERQNNQYSKTHLSESQMPQKDSKMLKRKTERTPCSIISCGNQLLYLPH